MKNFFGKNNVKFCFGIIIVFFGFFIIFLVKKNISLKYNSDYFEDKFINDFDTQKGVEYMKRCHEQDKVCSFLPFQSLISDFIWLKSIQNAGQTSFTVYDKNLYIELKTLTDLSPYWDYPYIFTQFLLPLQKNSYLNTGKNINNLEKKSWEQASLIGEKGIFFLCNTGNNLLYSCFDYQLPQSLGFTYFYYLNNLVKAKKYYEIAVRSSGSPEFLKNMPAIIEGRIGSHLKSAMMWYDKFLSEQKNKGENSEFFIKKAVFEFTLDIIEKSNEKQNICVNDLSCLQKRGFIQTTIKNIQKSCVNLQGDLEIASCLLLKYSLDNKFISFDGNLKYPFDDGSVYGYRLDIGDWWIIPN